MAYDLLRGQTQANWARGLPPSPPSPPPKEKKRVRLIRKPLPHSSMMRDIMHETVNDDERTFAENGGSAEREAFNRMRDD